MFLIHSGYISFVISMYYKCFLPVCGLSLHLFLMPFLIWRKPVIGCIASPSKRYVKVLISCVLECDIICRWNLRRGKQVKMRSLGWALIHCVWCLYAMKQIDREVPPRQRTWWGGTETRLMRLYSQKPQSSPANPQKPGEGPGTGSASQLSEGTHPNSPFTVGI